METQRWILDHVLQGAPVHPSSFAYSRGRSCAQAASQHLGARWLVKVDFMDFFGSIDERAVYDIYRRLGYQALVAFELARISTRPGRSAPLARSPRTYSGMRYRPGRLGALPQGAPTSGALANLHCHPLDEALSTWSIARGYVYTRYADDIAISGAGTLSESKYRQIVRAVDVNARRLRLRLNPTKTRKYGPGDRRAVLGILVDGDTLRLTPRFRSYVDGHLRAIEKFGLRPHSVHAGFRDELGLLNHVRGSIDYAHDVDPTWARPRYQRLDTALGRS